MKGRRYEFKVLPEYFLGRSEENYDMSSGFKLVTNARPDM
jgi:hypothetical protein